ncbi:carbohydrate ABC transporter permease [Deinococcus hopiensis]|uniref:Multiple sugar transport system permease protein n=1 Tax=Deinococcus hopiensis KR-140 TaxID=695939 RepID=A0A1W1URJ5_9DEIO|nr:carbohydrate ABC transporter permease [Deinococcus hopiensis]SMB83431.1 multiple sugar transport system permease protein [Deinococcus hopiensis KR-140]
MVRRTHFTPLQLMALGLFALYSLLPLWWVFVTMFKDNGQLFSTFGLWFGSASHLAENWHTLVTREDGVFTRWLINSVLYATATALGSMVVSAMAGYAFSIYEFTAKNALFALILATIMVPGTALVLPLFLMMQKLGLLNTYWAVILPALANPFGLYLMRLFWDSGFPRDVREAARIDGAGEWTTFWRLGLPLVRGGLVTVGLFAFVAAWNNFFLPLVVVNRSDLFPLTLGLSVWNQTSSSSGQEPLYTVIVLGAFISILPLLIAFLTLGRYWQGGLSSGAVKG